MRAASATLTKARSTGGEEVLSSAIDCGTAAVYNDLCRTMSCRSIAIVVLFLSSSCWMSHGPAADDDVADISAPVIGDWTFASPICDSVNRVVWVTLCADGTGWFSDFSDVPGEWQTFPRQATPLDARSVRFSPTAVGNAFESATLVLDPVDGRLSWTEQIGVEAGCGVIDSVAEPGPPEGGHFSPLPAHPCPP